MAHLRDYEVGDILKLRGNYIGIVSHSIEGQPQNSQDGKYIYLILQDGRFCGEPAIGIMNEFYNDSFTVIGNMNNLTGSFITNPFRIPFGSSIEEE